MVRPVTLERAAWSDGDLRIRPLFTVQNGIDELGAMFHCSFSEAEFHFFSQLPPIRVPVAVLAQVHDGYAVIAGDEGGLVDCEEYSGQGVELEGLDVGELVAVVLW